MSVRASARRGMAKFVHSGSYWTDGSNVYAVIGTVEFDDITFVRYCDKDIPEKVLTLDQTAFVNRFTLSKKVETVQKKAETVTVERVSEEKVRLVGWV